jgi:hypothetical protein
MHVMELAQTFQMELRILAQVVLAMILDAAVGFERETQDKPAGLHTRMLVEDQHKRTELSTSENPPGVRLLHAVAPTLVIGGEQWRI